MPVGEVLSSITAPINIGKKLIEVSDRTRDAESKLLVAELTLKLADIKMQLAEVIEENAQLKAKVNAEGEPCPKCRKLGWHVESSTPDSLTSQIGGIRRTYKCSYCDFSQAHLVAPHAPQAQGNRK
jgi:uncharacterized protein with PIN domain